MKFNLAITSLDIRQRMACVERLELAHKKMVKAQLVLHTVQKTMLKNMGPKRYQQLERRARRVQQIIRNYETAYFNEQEFLLGDDS